MEKPPLAGLIFDVFLAKESLFVQLLQSDLKLIGEMIEDDNWRPLSC